MAFFQNSVLKKYLATQDQALVKEAYAAYQNYFHHPARQQNIRAAKEEQFQEGFLRELFVNILGYTINPNPDYDLTTELKNIKDAKKTDGAILKDRQALAVIELKGTDTKDLEKIRDQAFNYKNNQPECVYVITSNFEKLRFYIDNAVDFLEFNILAMQLEEFKVFWLLLHKENLLSGIPKKIKEQSLLVEEQITKQLYADYSAFKQELWLDMVKLNADTDELELYQKSQKLLDRFLFIFFAEDKGLLPPNSIMEIVTHWNKLSDLDEYRPLYQIFKKYFGYLNTGRVQPGKAEIHAYNGGLFAPDPILDGLEISDQVLEKHVRKLTEYDFESEVDTNILGHIFEHSLNDIENVRAQLAGEVVDRSKTKRKRDGVFYTPKYITKYIVDNTLGKLCTEKKAELGIIDEDFAEGRRGRQKKTIQRLKEKLDTYRAWLLQLTICDPACGSGAFLNQVLEFLMAEHRYVDELESQLFDSPLILPNVENHILENNIFGVDINEESVQIARLSLWLRTAKKGRKLSSLNSNIKVGNSLIDDPEVAGDLAFNWSAQFPKVFAKGGFDVVVGNPPYVQSHSLDEQSKEFIYKNYKTAEYQINTYAVFMERILKILNDNCYYSVIIPNYWLSTKYDSRLRNQIFLENKCLEILNLFSVFEDATVDTVILTGEKTILSVFPKSTVVISIDKDLKSISERLSDLAEKKWAVIKDVEFVNLDSDTNLSFENVLMLNGQFKVSDFLKGYKGMQPYEKGKGTPPQTREMMNNKVYHSNVKIDDSYLPLIGAGNVQRFLIKPHKEYIKYGPNLAAPRNPDIFINPRLLVNRILSKEKVDITYAENPIVNNTDVFNFVPIQGKEEFLKPILAIIASKICSNYFRTSNVNLSRAAFPKLNVNNILSFVIPAISEDVRLKLSQLIDQSLEKTREKFEMETIFSKLLIAKFQIEKLSTKLQNWPSLDFKGFLGELKKAKVQLSLGEEAEWMAYFNEQKSKAQALQSEIDRIDQEIDHLVYELYGLTEEEIRIVEGR
ncbi:TaqI-like C-terminal specificity domain-containing protein [Algoriphagus faecimaris]|uniref:site-specific DNA-methyltransferase (adenine-specific) n=1 Tax=Algoriphagus faecimaris TaxID=686796 RepID=A0A1G6VLU3_9BACT|nr:N-6 DNA methylase [Algoriphagus faecimaris]SDD53987.1 TaqI-like C-terminal specificity domain-containing protein [Algoriphagus faecimaris]